MQKAFMLYIASNLPAPTSAQLDQLAVHDIGIFFHSIDVLPDKVNYSGVPDFSFYKGIRASIKTRNPRFKSGTYQPFAYTVPYDEAFQWVTNDDLLHKPDGSPVIGQVTGLTFKFLNIGKQSVRDKMIANYRDMMAREDFDYLMLDGFAPPFYRDILSTPGPASPPNPYFNLTTGCLDGATHQLSWWEENLSKYADQLRRGLEEDGRNLIAVGVAPGPHSFFGTNYEKLTDYVSSALYEHPTDVWNDPTKFDAALQTIQVATKKNKEMFLAVHPRLSGQVTTPAVQRFYQSMYHLVQEPGVFYSYCPFDPYRAWNDALVPTIYTSPDWDIDLGFPLGPYQKLPDPYGRGFVYVRLFTKGSIIVNPYPTGLQVLHPAPLGPVYIWDVSGYPLHMELAAPSYAMNIPPRTGWHIFPA